MSLAINVQDGTSAGKRRLLEAANWSHRCKAIMGLVQDPGPLVVLNKYSCPYCGARRP